jgi:multidrug resistance efflux pump
VYALFTLLLLAGISFPLVKVDVVCPTRGMVRPAETPVPLVSPLTSRMVECRLKDHLEVDRGDTLVVFPVREIGEQLRENQMAQAEMGDRIRDIEDILSKGKATRTPLYRQAQRDQQSRLEPLSIEFTLKKEALQMAELLHTEKVIPPREYDLARSDYLKARASLSLQEEFFRSRLESDLASLATELRNLKAGEERLRSGLAKSYLLAPSGGTIFQCRGYREGSVVSSGTLLGMLSLPSALVAECYAESHHIANVRPGAQMKVRLDQQNGNCPGNLTLTVWKVDPDVIFHEGRAKLRMVCTLDGHTSVPQDPESTTLRPGMTLSGHLVIGRESLWNLLLGKLRSPGDPDPPSRINGV